MEGPVGPASSQLFGGGQRDQPVMGAVQQQCRRRNPLDRGVELALSGVGGEQRTRGLNESPLSLPPSVAPARLLQVGLDDLAADLFRVASDQSENPGDDDLGLHHPASRGQRQLGHSRRQEADEEPLDESFADRTHPFGHGGVDQDQAADPNRLCGCFEN